MVEIRNARITSVSISNGDHGVLSAWVNLDYGDSGQCFGGYCLYNKNFPNADMCGFFIDSILKVVGAPNWEDLKGQTVRVKAEHKKVHAIGNILKDAWFDPSEEFTKRQIEREKV